VWLHLDLYPYYVIRVKYKGKSRLLALTREPMGSSHSAHVCQTATWALMAEVVEKRIAAASMIDNVAFATNDPNQFLWAVKKFMSNCKDAGFILNDLDEIPTDDVGILRWGTKNAEGPTAFLGEVFARGLISNTDKNLQKVSQAVERMNRPDTTPTRRQIAAIIGAITYTAHTSNIRMCEHFSVLRTFSEMAADISLWDSPMRISPQASTAITDLARQVAQAGRQPILRIPPPSTLADDYDAIIIVDAWQEGWAAFVSLKRAECDRHTVRLTEGFNRIIKHSAWAEPIAATRALQWARNQVGSHAAVAVVTDHEALASGQRRHWSAHGGASTSWFLNEFYRELYNNEPDRLGKVPRADVFHVAGEKNMADAPSRGARVGCPLRIEETQVVIPNLIQFTQPPEKRERPWWNV
jgi:hypothetical protein